MGTDIHGVFQKRAGGKWEDIPSNYDQSRHYLLFAWLGDVRNGSGFAGVATHDPLTPLSSCRGYPADFAVTDDEHPIDSVDVIDPVRREYREEDDGMTIWMGNHSHSWVAVDEVLSGNLRPIKKTGIIGIKAFREWDGKSSPGSYCGAVGGPGVLVSDPQNITQETSHVRIEWESDTSDELSYFVDEVRRLKEEHGDVRFVFGFDN